MLADIYFKKLERGALISQSTSNLSIMHCNIAIILLFPSSLFPWWKIPVLNISWASLQDDLDNPIIQEELDTSNGVLFPLYDEDTGLLYLVGKVATDSRSINSN